MSDSFFGFETTLPLNSDLEENTCGQNDETGEEDLKKKFKGLSFDPEDFGDLGDEQNDLIDLLEQLEETRDAYNDETFGNVGDIGAFVTPAKFLNSDHFALGLGLFLMI